MKTFAKKSLSVVLAMLMALSTLTVGAMAAFAEDTIPYSDNISVSGTATQAVTKTISYTAPKTGCYSVMLSVAVQDQSKDYAYASFGVYEKFGEDDEDYDQIAYSDTEQIAFYSVANDVRSITESYLPAQTMVDLTKGETYQIKVTASDNTNAWLLVSQSDFKYNLGTYQAQLSYNNYTDVKYNEATGKYDLIIVPCDTTVVTDHTVGICANVTGYDGTNTTVAVPGSIAGYPVKEVSLESTKRVLSERIVAVSIPEGVETIGGMSDFYALTSVNFPSTLKTIDYSAFNGCHSLAGRITIPSSVKNIGSYAFYDTAVTSVELTSKKTNVSYQALGYKEVLNEATVDPRDTTTAKVADFFVIAPTGSLAAQYAANNGFAAYDRANCLAGNHPYAVTTVAATFFSKGSKTSVCPVCGATAKKTIAKKTFKIKSLKSSKKNTIVVKTAALKGITGYQVQYSTSKKFTKKTTKTVNVKSTKALNKTIKGLKGGKKYFVRVRATGVNAKGKTVYSKYAATKSVKVKK